MLASTDASTLRMLPPGTRVLDVADACRSAALGFAWGAPAWGRRELARWLAGPYAAAIDATRAPHSPSPSSRAQGEIRPVAEDDLLRVLQSAHSGLLDTLRSAWTACHEGSLSCTMIDLGLVTSVMDDEFGIGYAPVDYPRLRLVDRVTSLFVADFLTRPSDYDAFSVCAECGAVTFDWFSHVDECEEAAISMTHVRSAPVAPSSPPRSSRVRLEPRTPAPSSPSSPESVPITVEDVVAAAG